jgi:hypothetical protein
VCIDWTERREHPAGALRATVYSMVQGAGSVVRRLASRARLLTRRGEVELDNLAIALGDVCPVA